MPAIVAVRQIDGKPSPETVDLSVCIPYTDFPDWRPTGEDGYESSDGPLFWETGKDRWILVVVTKGPGGGRLRATRDAALALEWLEGKGYPPGGGRLDAVLLTRDAALAWLGSHGYPNPYPRGSEGNPYIPFSEGMEDYHRNWARDLTEAVEKLRREMLVTTSLAERRAIKELSDGHLRQLDLIRLRFREAGIELDAPQAAVPTALPGKAPDERTASTAPRPDPNPPEVGIDPVEARIERRFPRPGK